MMVRSIGWVCMVLGCSVSWAIEGPLRVKAPDSDLSVECTVDKGMPVYQVLWGRETLLQSSPLGLECSAGDFTQHLKISMISAIKPVTDHYTLLHGKRRQCEYHANQGIITLENAEKQLCQVVFRVSNTGVAFCYRLGSLGGIPSVTIKREASGFTFPPKTTCWLHPLHNAKTGWKRTYPSYESHYVIDAPIGQPAPYAAGWAFPALFKVGSHGWVLISETNVNGQYCGSRLGPKSEGGIYHLAFPQEQEQRGPQDPVQPTMQLPFESPWRILIVSKNLGDIVESTLATDLAAPCRIKDTSFIKPGRAGWSWLRYDTAGTQLPKLEEYLDMTASLSWEYLLVDADWDQIVGYDKIAKLAQKAKSKGVSLILWYNSNGQWNDAPFTPKDKMDQPKVRQAEFKRLHQMGIAGVKVDFFGGDKQATMQLYMDILKDAADAHLLCNFHGATVPRGWQRTWPNLMTTEAVMGMEYCTFDQKNTDQEAQHCTVLGFTRNVVAPMDFTPMVMSRSIRGVHRVTSPAFELALPMIFESGIQHFGIDPFEVKQLPDFVVNYLKVVPTAWDQTHFVTGTPGKDMVIARRRGNTWFVAGINGEKKAKTLTLDLSFLPSSSSGTLITDDPAHKDQLVMKKIEHPASLPLVLNLLPEGGFVLMAQ